MKRSLLLITVVCVVFLISVFSFKLFSPRRTSAYEDVISPLPEFMTLKQNDQVRLLDFWQPLLDVFGTSDEVTVSAKSALLFDLESNKTLFEKNPTERLPMASLTKIMTAIVALENLDPKDSYSVRQEHVVGEDSMGVTAGESLGFEDLLYGLLLPSGNDAAEVLAGNFPGGRSAFVRAMNKKALALGLKDTNFTNPSGLQGDGDQYTTAYDLLVITKYALENFPLFREVVATYEHTIPSTSTHKAFYLFNETNLLTSYPGVKGVKTGFTPEAGLCLVTYLEYKGHRIVGILLDSQNRRQEMKDLLDYSLKSLSIDPPVHD